MGFPMHLMPNRVWYPRPVGIAVASEHFAFVATEAVNQSLGPSTQFASEKPLLPRTTEQSMDWSRNNKYGW